MDSVALANNDTLSEWYTNNLPDKLGKLMEIENTLAIGDYQNAQSLIDGFNPETNIQYNFKTYFQVYRNFRVYTNLNDNDSIALLYLANQCPFTDGPAVFKARALYDLINNTAEIYNDDNCVPEGYSMRQLNSSNNNKLLIDLKNNELNRFNSQDNSENYFLFPNPACEKFAIKGSGDNEKIQVKIIDVTGRTLFIRNVNLSEYGTVIDAKLNSGIYFITIINSKSKVICKKLIINN